MIRPTWSTSKPSGKMIKGLPSDPAAVRHVVSEHGDPDRVLVELSHPSAMAATRLFVPQATDFDMADTNLI
jgi:hypothetical protein